MKGSDSTYVADGFTVLLNLLVYWRVIGQRVTSGHEAFVGLLVPSLRDWKEMVMK